MELFATKELIEGLASEAAKEAVSEFGKLNGCLTDENILLGKLDTATEAVCEFGKLNGSLTDESILLGKLDTATEAVDSYGQLSFGSLANKQFKNYEKYNKWQDGVNLGELGEQFLEKLSNEIANIYGIKDVDVSKKYVNIVKKTDGLDIKRFYNAAMIYGNNIQEIIYGPKFLKDCANDYGIDTILGILSHEVGHKVFQTTGLQKDLYIMFENIENKEQLDKIFENIPDILPHRKSQGVNRSSYLNEACADYIAGLTARLSGFDKDHMISWFKDRSKRCGDGEHPGSPVRIEAFMRGYNRIDIGAEAKGLKIFEDFSPYDRMGRIYQNQNVLRGVLEEDIINPILNGTFKIV